MKLKLIHKLLIAMLISTALVLILVTLVSSASIGRNFEQFLHQQERNQVEQLIPELSRWYSERGSWQSLDDDPREFLRMALSILFQGAETRGITDMQRENGQGRGPGRRPRGPPGTPGAGRVDDPPGLGPGPRTDRGIRNGLPQRIFLLDAGKQVVVGRFPAGFDQDTLMPVEVDGDIVGWLGVVRARGISLPEEAAFLIQLRKSLLIGLGLGLVIAFLLAWYLAKHLSKPVNQVADGIRALAAGQFGQQLESRGSDEISRLTEDVNRLSSALNEHESSRKRWMSDMAHELRTPLAIISGELEAMSDGIRPLDLQQLASVQEEVKHLASLVEDLHSLTLTDSGALAYKMRPLDIGELVRMSVESFEGAAQSKGLSLRKKFPEDAVRINGDERRLRQLLHNLLDNAVNYTNENGHISIMLKTQGQQLSLVVSDSAPGATEEECKRLFDRLYRVEGSRNRKSGGSGLGLAICRNIVEAHGGSITARPSESAGLELTVLLPLVP